MTRHVFFTARGQAWPRWIAAFPGSILISDGTHGVRPEEGDSVWVSTDLDAWPTRVRALCKDSPGVPVVVLSLQPSQDEALEALAAGAQGYCHTLSTPESLRETDVVVRHGGLWVGAELVGRLLGAVRKRLPEPDALQGLSPREQEVARAVASGLTNKEVARRLGITERTIKAHLGAVFEKLGVRDRLQLALRVGREDTDSPGTSPVHRSNVVDSAMPLS